MSQPIIILIIIIIFFGIAGCASVISSVAYSQRKAIKKWFKKFGGGETNAHRSFWERREGGVGGSTGSGPTFGGAAACPEDKVNTCCGKLFKEFNCELGGDKTAWFTATRVPNEDEGLVDIRIGDWDRQVLEDWDDQGGRSFQLQGNCDDIKIIDVNNGTYEPGPQWIPTAPGKCFNIPPTQAEDIDRIQWKVAETRTPAEDRHPDNYTECHISINDELCPHDGDGNFISRDSSREEPATEVLTATSNEGRKIANLDTVNYGGATEPQVRRADGESNWPDQNGYSIDIKGSCNDVVVRSCEEETFLESDGCSEGREPAIFHMLKPGTSNFQPSPTQPTQDGLTSWRCHNLPGSIQGNVGEVSWEASMTANERRTLSAASSAPDCKDLSGIRYRRGYSCDGITRRPAAPGPGSYCNTIIDDWGYLCMEPDEDMAVTRDGGIPSDSSPNCQFMRRSPGLTTKAACFGLPGPGTPVAIYGSKGQRLGPADR